VVRGKVCSRCLFVVDVGLKKKEKEWINLRWTKLVLLALVLTLTLSSAALAKVNITFWHAMGAELGEAVDYLTKKFNEEQDEIFVESIYQGRYSDLNTKLVASFSAGTSPTIAQVYENWTDAYYRYGVIAPLEDYMDLTEEEYNDYIEVFRHMNTWDGKLYTIPFNKSNWVLYYNKELIPEPPKTLDEFFQIAKDVTAKTNGETKGFGIRPTLELFHAFLWLNGSDFFDADLNVTFDGPEGKKALQQMIGMLEDGSALLIDGYEDASFGDRMIAMYIGSSAGITYAENSVGGKFEFSTAPLPSGVRPGAPFMGTNIALFDAATEEEKAAAAKFVKWLTNADNTVYFATKTGYLPVTYSGLSHPEYQAWLAANPHKAAIANLEAFEYGYWQPKIAAWEECRGLISEMVTKVFLGEDIDLSLAEGRYRIEEVIQEMLNERF
jgi:multiple sugar transport system substrate-binding protein